MNQIIPFETSKCNGLFVVVQEGFKAPHIAFVLNVPFLLQIGERIDNSIQLPHGNWQLLGLLNEVSEGQAEFNSLARSLNVSENSVVLIENK